MFKILKKAKLNDQTTYLEVAAPLIARAARPGNFIVVIPTANAERIPLTIADADQEQGTITIIFQTVGATTLMLDSLKVGDELAHLLGPLGTPTHIDKFGKVVVIGGGVGIAEIYPVVKALKAAGNIVRTIIGARNKAALLFTAELKSQSTQLDITTDDGSIGRRGFVSDVLKEILQSGDKIDLVIAVGPVPMMKVCSEVTKPYGVKTVVSLNTLMLDATGMCGICRVTVGGQPRFACVDGPEFDGHQVDFVELMTRLQSYKNEEKVAREHVCRLLGG